MRDSEPARPRRAHRSRRPIAFVLPALIPVLLATPSAAQEPAGPPEVRADETPLATVPARGAAPRSLRLGPAGGPIVLDGRLDDAAWQAAEVAADWVQQRPSPGATASQRSEARILHDDRAIYVGLRLFDTAPDSIVAPLARRDFDGYSDWAHVLIDGLLDRRTAFRFSVNPAGVKADAHVTGDDSGEEDPSWDAVWDAAVARDSLGWTAELRIPLSQLRFAQSDASAERGRSWGIQFARDLARNGERSYWAPVPPDAAGFVSRFGLLHGVDLGAPRRLVVTPYSVARLERSLVADAGPLGQANERSGSFGVDLQLGLGAELTLTGTVRPDFGQLEADPAEVNLTTSETLLSERRPFFVEGANLFRMRMDVAGWIHGEEHVFYTRRIGREPRAPLPDARWTERPDATRLLAAAKLSGRTAGGWSVGLLSALTDEELGRVADEQGEVATVPIEPLTHYAVARVARDLNGGESGVGAILTATHRRRTGALDALLARRAWVGGFDARHRFGGGDFQATGTLLASHVSGSATAIDAVARGPVHFQHRPDAGHVGYDADRTELTGMSAGFELAKSAGGTWRTGVTARVVTPGFEANDLGYQPRSDLALAQAWVGRQVYRPSRHTREWSSFFSLWSSRDFGGDGLGTGAELFGHAELTNRWRVEGAIMREAAALSPVALRGGPGLRTSPRTSGRLALSSDPRHPVRLELESSFAFDDEKGGRRGSVEPGIVIRPAARLDLALRPAYSWNTDPAQYVVRLEADAGELHLVGALEQTTLMLTARVDYTLTPELSLQLYAQPFVSTGSYSRFRWVDDPRAGEFERRYRTVADAALSPSPDGEQLRIQLEGEGAPELSFDRPDFAIHELNANAVIRWEFRAGSTLFLVWSHTRDRVDAAPNPRLRPAAERLFRLDASNLFTAKLSYRFGR